jgi:hypothetical protein
VPPIGAVAVFLGAEQDKTAQGAGALRGTPSSILHGATSPPGLFRRVAPRPFLKRLSALPRLGPPALATSAVPGILPLRSPFARLLFALPQIFSPPREKLRKRRKSERRQQCKMQNAKWSSPTSEQPRAAVLLRGPSALPVEQPHRHAPGLSPSGHDWWIRITKKRKTKVRKRRRGQGDRILFLRSFEWRHRSCRERSADPFADQTHPARCIAAFRVLFFRAFVIRLQLAGPSRLPNS